MRGTSTPANSAYPAVNSAKRHRRWRWVPCGPNRRSHVIGLLWIMAEVAALSPNFSGRRETIFDVENAKTSANQILIRLRGRKIISTEMATVNDNYRWVYFTVVWDKSSPY
jgi:hypothetical protein